jgi:CheY-like chemotaxis protein
MTSGARILIADDDAVSCQVLANRLQKLGYNAVIARDGDEAKPTSGCLIVEAKQNSHGRG